LLPDRTRYGVELLPENEIIFRAFRDLNGDRGDTRQIMWRSIDQWAQRYEVEGDSFEDLTHLLSALDRRYVEIILEREKEASKR